MPSFSTAQEEQLTETLAQGEGPVQLPIKLFCYQNTGITNFFMLHCMITMQLS
jgi:hypothetical protein